MITKTKEFTECNILGVTVGTTGLCGGDSGHGGRTFISITDLAGTDIEFSFTENPKSIQIMLGGDSELNTIIDALCFASNALKEARDGVIENTGDTEDYWRGYVDRCDEEELQNITLSATEKVAN